MQADALMEIIKRDELARPKVFINSPQYLCSQCGMVMEILSTRFNAEGKPVFKDRVICRTPDCELRGVKFRVELEKIRVEPIVNE